MKLIVMTKPTFFVEEDKILATLFEEGLESLHLSKSSAEPVYTERLLTLLSEEYRNRITVHNHYYLKEEFRLRGIHLDSDTDVLPAGYKGAVGRTCRHIEELKEMKRRSNYVLLANMFDSLSNPSEKQTLNADQLKEASRRGIIDKRVYAMGGMTLENIRTAKDYGFGGVVVCGDLWNRFNIHHEKDFKELLTHFEKLRKAAG